MVSLVWCSIILLVFINLSLGGREKGYEDWTEVETRPNQEFEVSRDVVNGKKDARDIAMPEKSSSTFITTPSIKVKKKKKKLSKRRNVNTPRRIKKKHKKIVKHKIVSYNDTSDPVEMDRKPLDIIVHIKMKK